MAGATEERTTNRTAADEAGRTRSIVAEADVPPVPDQPFEPAPIIPDPNPNPDPAPIIPDPNPNPEPAPPIPDPDPMQMGVGVGQP